MGSLERVLERGLVAERRGVDRAERFLDGPRVGLEAGDVLGEQAFERGSDVRDREDGVGGELLQADPEAHVVAPEAPVLTEAVDGGGDHHQLVRAGAGDGEVVLPEGPPGQVADHRPRRHAQQDRVEQLQQRAEHGGHAVVELGRQVVARRRRRGAERAGEPFEERTVGVEGALRPGGLGDRQDVDGPPVDGGVEAGGVLHVQLGDARQVGPLEADGGVDVGRRLALGGHHQGELAGRVPVHRTLPLQHLGELAEEGDALERIVTEWTGAAHWGTIGS